MEFADLLKNDNVAFSYVAEAQSEIRGFQGTDFWQQATIPIPST
jgi:hypothetical protein